MLRNAPPLEAIEIFVAASRGDSFRSVARQLALSPSAVSRRIAALEAFLGLQLFDRSGQSQRLTAAGERYVALVEPAITAIKRAGASIAHPDQTPLKIAASHSFAAAWLMPRLAGLHRQHGIEVEVIPTRDTDVLRSGEAHLGIWGGLVIPDDMNAEDLVQADVVPVSARMMADGRHAPRREDELVHHTLLSIRSPAGLWDRWFASCEKAVTRKPPIREYATLQLMYEAAASGAGVALAMPLVSEPWLRAGKLVPCHLRSVSLGETYRLFRLSQRPSRSIIEHRFCAWLQGEVKASMAWFGDWAAAVKGGCQPSSQ